jgi:phosphoribosylaminoimidazole synthetase
VRKVVERSGLAWSAPAPFAPKQTLANALLTPTRIYVKALLPLIRGGKLKGLAHITGGGLVENTPRALPKTAHAKFDWSGWKRPAVFEWLQQTGAIPEEDIRRTFNLGIGMVAIASKSEADGVIAALNQAGETAFVIGEVG